VSGAHRSEVEGRLPDGLLVRPLQPHEDDRGTFVELHRREWSTGVEPVQWNAVHNQPGVLRGVHVHPRHDDYLTVVRGRALVGVRDLRPGSPTAGAAACIELSAERPRAVTIPHGVAHGFWFPEASTHIYAVSHYWDLADELGCRWDDRALEIPWPQRQAHISPRDEALPSLETLLGELRAVWREGALAEPTRG
jgi:dTDP-4-dehydrorhamnose 3,5-epimerase